MQGDNEILDFLRQQKRDCPPTKSPYYSAEHRNFDNFIFTNFTKSKETLLIQPISYLVLNFALNYYTEHLCQTGELNNATREMNRVMMVTQCPQNLIHSYLPDMVMKTITDALYAIEHQFRTDTATRESNVLTYCMLAPAQDVQAYMEANYPFLNYTITQHPAMYAVSDDKVIFFKEDGTYDPQGASGKGGINLPKNIGELGESVLVHYRKRKLQLLTADSQ